jgi:hypothetical protein
MEMTCHHVVFDEEQQIGAGEYTFQGRNRYHGVVVMRILHGRIANWREYQRRLRPRLGRLRRPEPLLTARRPAGPGAELAPKHRDSRPGQVVEDGDRRSESEGNVDEDARRGGAAVLAQTARLMDKLADSLVARPRQAKPLRVAPDAPAGLGDRVTAVVVANHRLEQLLPDAGRKRRHSRQCRRTRAVTLRPLCAK